MKRTILPALFLALALPAAAQEAAAPAAPVRPASSGRPLLGVEARFGGVAFDADCWEDDVAAFGDVGLTVWEPDGLFGVWLGLGAQAASYEWEDDWGRVESDVSAVPFGASLLLDLDLAPGLALRAEAGARYVAMDVDDWDDDYHYRHHRHRDSEWDRYRHPERYLDVDDTSLAVVALQLEIDLSPAWIAFGGGYQFDLRKPDIEYLGRPIGEVDLSGALFFVDVGIVF